MFSLLTLHLSCLRTLTLALSLAPPLIVHGVLCVGFGLSNIINYCMLMTYDLCSLSSSWVACNLQPTLF
jgi:hypothetical protein